jgi:predicted nucleotidyltransferase
VNHQLEVSKAEPVIDGVTEQQLILIQKILAGTEKVLAFGSRVTGKSQKFSDLDLAIMDIPPPSAIQMALWAELFDNSDLPFVVDLCRFGDLPVFLQEAVREVGVELKPVK